MNTEQICTPVHMDAIILYTMIFIYIYIYILSQRIYFMCVWLISALGGEEEV